MKKKGRIILFSVLAVILALVIASAVYVNDYYHADESVSAYLESGDTVTVKTFSDEGISGTNGYFFDGPGTENALIFYPGAKVEYTAYAPLLYHLAQEGVDVFLCRMPANLAIFGKEAAAYVMNAEDSYTGWYTGGHSLGGAMAGDWTASNLSDLSIKGCVFLAAYPTGSLARDGFKALTIYGSEDGVLNQNSLEKAAQYLPEDSTTYVIEGGNHAQFGSYGAQKKDGEAKISREEQQEITVEQILEMVNG